MNKAYLFAIRESTRATYVPHNTTLKLITQILYREKPLETESYTYPLSRKGQTDLPQENHSFGEHIYLSHTTTTSELRSDVLPSRQ